MKKALLAISAFLLIVVLMGCVTTTSTTTTNPPATTTTTTTQPDHYPVISGATDVTIEKNSGFVPLAGVTASDEEDGDLTASIVYSGDVNPNAVGVYTATYTVTDSDGNITTVERIIVVVFVDRAAPLIAGVANETIYVGQDFDPLDGISATDTIDGEVEVTVTGSVDIWTPGDYDLVYTAQDKFGNKAEMPRRITVGYGDFIFHDLANVDFGTWTVASGVYTSPVLSGFVINDAIANFTYLKLVITAKADVAGNATIALGDSPANMATLALTTADQVFTVLFVIDAGSTADSIVITGTGLTITMTAQSCFAEIRDLVFPTLNVPSEEGAYIVNLPQAGLEAYLLKGVTAVDDIDGNITSNITIDYGTLDLATVGVYDVTYKVKDAGNNETTFVRHITIGNAVDSGYLTDPTFQTSGDGQWNEKSNNGEVDITYDAASATMAILVIKDGDWTSAAGAYFSQSSAGLETDVWYCLSFSVKTTLARTMWFRMGLQTDQAHGWLDDFDGNAAGNALSLTTDYQTFYFYFKLDSLTSSSGDSVFKIELNLGDPNYGNKGNGQTTTFQNVILNKVVTEFSAPTYTENFNPAVDMPTIFTVGATEPDWATYVTFKDMSANVLTPTITDNVNMAAAGAYEVNYSVTDSHDKTTTYVLHVTVVAAETADTVGPVITKAASVPENLVFDQYTSLNVDFLALVTINDAVDGAIAPTLAMVDDGGLDFNKAGVYTVTYTCYDKSGNVGTFSATVTVNDKQVPAITIGDKTINVGELFDPKSGLAVIDNVDGTMSKDAVIITGVDAFTDANGIVDLAGEFTVTYEITDAAGNKATKTITVTVANIVWDTAKEIVLTTPNETPYHCTVTDDAVEAAKKISGISQDEWLQPARLVFYFTKTTQIVQGRTYMFEINVKADQATTLGFRVGSTLSVDPWIDNFKGGNQTIAITTEYVTYRVVFTADKTISSNVKFQFQFGYNAFDTTNNIYVKSLKLIPEKQPIADTVSLLVSDAKAFTGSVGNGITVGTDPIEGAATISNIPAYTYDWMTGKLTYYFNSSVLQYGQTYRFAITMKAKTETQVKFWVGTGLNADPWIDTFSNCKAVALTAGTSYTTQYVYFTVDKATFGAGAPAKFEFTIGYGNDAANTLYVQSFALQHFLPAAETFDITAFDAIADKNAGTVAAPNYADLAAVLAALPTTVTAYDGQVTVPVASWTDTDTFNPAVVGSYTFTAVLGTLPNGFSNTGSVTITLEVVVHMDASQMNVNDFESYVDNADYQANTTDTIVGTRVASGDFVKSKGSILDIEGNAVLMSDIQAGTNGIKIRVTKAGLPATAKYIAVWMKATSTTGLNNFQSFIYSASGYNEVTSSLIADFKDLGKGTIVYLPVSALKDDTIIVSFVVNAGATADGDLYIDNIQYVESVPANAAPVVSISAENLALISGLTLKAGENIESLAATLLGMISISDAEDGVIASSSATVFLNGLDLVAPVMGTYSIKVYCKDSDNAYSNVLSIPVWIVTVLQDYESFADDAAFKAAATSVSRYYGMRTTGGTMGPTIGSLIADPFNATNHVLSCTYGYNTTSWNGMNGIAVYVSKAELVAAGATYIGLRLQMVGTIISGTALQFYDYKGVYTDYQQRTAYGTIGYVGTGTYVWLKVSELREGTIMLSFQANVKNGSTGTLYVDNIVIR